MMLIDYLPILFFFAIAVIFACFAVMASYLLGQRKQTLIKEAPFECGMPTYGSSFHRIPIKYYIIAMLFLIFDIEIAFLYPWAVVFQDKDLKVVSFISMSVFIGILIIAYIYVWKKGALEWE
jgi:NADH-quinone oxidoreductase subunit A